MLFRFRTLWGVYQKKKKSDGKGKKEIKGPTSYGTVQRAPKRQQLPQGKISRASATRLGGMAAGGIATETRPISDEGYSG